MIALIVLGILSIVAVGATVIAVARDGYGPVRTDWSRLPDRDDPVAPSAAAIPATTRDAHVPVTAASARVAPAAPVASATPVRGTRVTAPTPETPHHAPLEHAGSTART